MTTTERNTRLGGDERPCANAPGTSPTVEQKAADVVVRLRLIVNELQGLPHVVETCREAIAALSPPAAALAPRVEGWSDAEQLAYWRKGHAIIEGRLAKAVAAKHDDAPFPLDANEAANWHCAQADAYRDALEMMGVPECAAPTPADTDEGA